MKNPSFFYKVGQEICKAQTNTSTAKYQYSFPKAERFKGDNKKKEDLEREKEELKKEREENKKKEEKNIYVKHDFYLLPSTLSKRYTNFDYFSKDEKTEKKKLAKSERAEPLFKPYRDLNPEEKLKRLNEFAEYEYERKYFHGPHYTIPKFGNLKNKKKDKKKGENEEEEKEEKEKPEDKPKVKQELKDFGADAPKYSIKGIPDPDILKMRERIKEKIDAMDKEKREKLFEKLHIKEAPLPEITIKITQGGKYAPSQIPNVNSVRIQKPFKVRDEQRHKLETNNNTEAKERQKELEKKIDEYIEKDIIREPKDEKQLKAMLFSLMGDNFPSKYRSNGRITLTEKHKVKDSRENYPGPGSYLLPSDFGIYRSPNAPPYPEENVYPEKKIPFEEAAWRHGMKKIKPIEENEEEENIENGGEENHEEEGQKEEEEEKEEEKEEDKESELEMLRDILMYPKENEEENKEEKVQQKEQQKVQQKEQQKELQKEQQQKEQQQKEQQQKEQQQKEQQQKEQQQKEQQKEEEKKEEKEEDKESECIMLRDVLVYPK